MKLNPERFIDDEKFSNHAIQGYSHPECPINKGCFAQATGFGGAIKTLCNHFDVKDCTCNYQEEILDN